MRGITIAGMLLVNNPGSWTHVYAPLRHADWFGITPTDLVFPFFMFIMGVSMQFSLMKYDDGLTGSAFWKIARRGILIFVVGAALQWFSCFCEGISWLIEGRGGEGVTFSGIAFPWKTFRIMGVLQALGIAYFFGALIFLTVRGKHLLWIAGAILVLYIVILQLGNGYELSRDNIIAVIDRAVLGESHLYQARLADGTRIGFEPEALLSTLPRIAHVLLGVYVGRIITSLKNNTERIERIFVFGTIILFIGLLLQWGDPLNKKIWSSSYTLVTCGFASLLLALLIWIIDIKKRVAWSRFFEVYGINPLFLYVVGWVLSVLFRISIPSGTGTTSIKGFLYGDVFQPLLGNELGSLAYAVFFVVVAWVFGYVLYRKKIYIKL